MAGFSLMNGLSAAGAGISDYAGEVGLTAQKAALAQQQAILADQLATKRGLTLQGQAGQIAAEAQGRQQTFQAGEGALTRAAEMARTQAEQSGATARTAMTVNAPPDVIKVLRAVGALPDPNAPTPPATPGAAPTTTGSASGASSPASSAATATTPAVMPTVAGSANPNADLVSSVVRKSLGQPMPGSPEANRMAIADDVKNDPAFKYKSAGQQATEVETRLAVSEGKMTDPTSRHDTARAIASYQLAPLSNYALNKAGGPETMAEVMQINPDYQSSRYPEVSKVMSAFGSGKQGDIVRSLNVGVQHLDVIDLAAKALQNHDTQLLNSLQNQFIQQFGQPEPTTFEGLKQIVGTEIEKAIAGGIGASSDRDRLMASLASKNSPAQLQEMTNGFRSLMVGQLAGLKAQYEDGTGFKTGPFAFENKLVPATQKALGLHIGDATATPPTVAATIPPWVKPGDQYSPSRGQARGADGTLYGPPQ